MTVCLDDIETTYLYNPVTTLVMSCSQHRELKSGTTDFGRPPIEQDYEMADKIVEYYRNKITMCSLVNGKASKFRTALYHFLTTVKSSDGKQSVRYNEEMTGLITKLPEFYEYDTELEKIFGGSRRILTDSDKSLRSGDIENPEFKGKLLRKTSRNRYFEYWFEIDKSDMAALRIDVTNPLEPLFHEKATTGDLSLSVSVMSPYKRDFLEFYQLLGWRIYFKV